MNKIAKRINDKYKNLSRFAVLSGESYWKLYSFIYSGDKGKEAYIKALILNTPDKLIKGELGSMQLALIANALPEDVKQFCRDNGVQHYWLQSLLKGEIVFLNKRVLRLMNLLKLKP